MESMPKQVRNGPRAQTWHNLNELGRLMGGPFGVDRLGLSNGGQCRKKLQR